MSFRVLENAVVRTPWENRNSVRDGVCSCVWRVWNKLHKPCVWRHRFCFDTDTPSHVSSEVTERSTPSCIHLQLHVKSLVLLSSMDCNHCENLSENPSSCTCLKNPRSVDHYSCWRLVTRPWIIPIHGLVRTTPWIMTHTHTNLPKFHRWVHRSVTGDCESFSEMTPVR